MGLAGVPQAPLRMHKPIASAEQERAALRAEEKHSPAAVTLNLLLTSFASQQCHADVLLLHQVWWCWMYGVELCFMLPSAGLTTGVVLAKSAKTAADPHLEVQVLYPFRKWIVVETARDPKSRHV